MSENSLVEQRLPLVSICIPNYNYAQYLGACLDSVLAQTYSNFEVILSDNQSQDDSYELMIQYRTRFLERNIWCEVLQNKKNIGSGGNTARCFNASEGSYYIWLSADDFLEPDAIETMVKAAQMYPSAGVIMAHRNEVNDEGERSQTAPFYNQSCFIPGEAQASVYMMAGIAVSSQILFKREAYIRMLRYKTLRFQVAGDWYDNFLMACVSDVVYIKKALINYRVHQENETSVSERNLTGIFEHYNLLHAFCSTAESFGMKKPQTRLPEAITKLGYMCLRYARKMILCEEYDIADKYLNLSTIFCNEIESDSQYRMLRQCLSEKNQDEARKLLDTDGIFRRTISYDPPEGFISIEI